MEGLHPIYMEGHHRTTTGLPRLINELGSPRFAGGLFDFFNQTSVVEHCGVYVLNSLKIQKYAGMSHDGSGKSRQFVDLYIDNGYWQADPTMQLIDDEARAHDFFLIGVDMNSVGGTNLREDLFLSQRMQHRLMVCLKLDEGVGVLDLVRSTNYGPFAHDCLDAYSSTTDVLLPLILKHFKVLSGHPHIGNDILKDLSSIGERLAAKEAHLPQRERQVAARILYGQSTLGISIDLGIAEETVATYRKRLYSRLQISSQQELCRWFLKAP